MNPVALPVAIALLFAAGCSDPQQPREADPHAGHNHGPSTPRVDGAVCVLHGAPVARCFICDASLREPGRLWCAEHDRYEDRCWGCHPELQETGRAWCAEHSLYEDECFLCHPEIEAGEGGADHNAPLMCSEHGVPEAECGICRPDVVGALKPGEGIKVRMPSTASAGMVGVETDRGKPGGLGEAIECLAELAFNQNRLAQIVAPVGGIVQSVDADLGSLVEEGQTVATLWSASIAEAVAKAVLTHQTLERERRLRLERVTAEADLQQAEAAHRAACQQLHTLGFSEEQIDQMSETPGEAVLLDVRAPLTGEIVERSAVRGSLVEPGKALFVVADRSVMWAELSIPETDLSRVQTGQRVEVVVDALPGEVFTGRLTWIGPAVDERTRMARARAEIPNPAGQLRDRMFARARIITQPSGGALMVPASAIQLVDGRPLVFVRLADDLFEARAVRLGSRQGDRQEILAGLAASDPVVTQAGFAVKSQLLLSRLGAGCAHE
jgi:cobalt-zinc-cadmium efflux system membrane fusion protein